MDSGKKLRDLNVKPGDVVAVTRVYEYNHKQFVSKEYTCYDEKLYGKKVVTKGPLWLESEDGTWISYKCNWLFRVVSRAGEKEKCSTCAGTGVIDKFSTFEDSCPDCTKFKPKVLSDMSDKEIGELVRTEIYGTNVEYYSKMYDVWKEKPIGDKFHNHIAYRIKPIVTEHEVSDNRVLFTYKQNNGIVDINSVEMKIL